MTRHLLKAMILGLMLVVAGCSNLRDESQNPGQNATPGSAEDFTLNVGNKIFFLTDSSELTPEAKATLDRQAAWLKIYPRYSLVNLEGHADERGTREYNLSLGARRANAARNYLISQGIPADRMKVISFGKERPVAVCNDISCWSQNRRVETLLQAQ